MKRRDGVLSPKVHSRLARELEQAAADAARTALAGAVLCDGLSRELAMDLELARPIDSAGRVPGTLATVKAYAAEECSLPALARLTSERFSGREFVRLEVFRWVGGNWQDTGHAVLELSAARVLAAEILKIEAASPTPGGAVQ